MWSHPSRPFVHGHLLTKKVITWNVLRENFSCLFSFKCEIFIVLFFSSDIKDFPGGRRRCAFGILWQSSQTLVTLEFLLPFTLMCWYCFCVKVAWTKIKTKISFCLLLKCEAWMTWRKSFLVKILLVATKNVYYRHNVVIVCWKAHSSWISKHPASKTCEFQFIWAKQFFMYYLHTHLKNTPFKTLLF